MKKKEAFALLKERIKSARIGNEDEMTDGSDRISGHSRRQSGGALFILCGGF